MPGEAAKVRRPHCGTRDANANRPAPRPLPLFEEGVILMIRVGIAGIGFMGWIHYLAYKNTPDVQLAAVSEPNEKRLAGDWRDIKGNFGPPGEMVDLSNVAKYVDYREMLADPNVDLVDFCLPPSMHAEAARAAFAAGKQVFCEKPMALTTDDCDAMVQAAQQAGKQLFIGHVLPFFPEYAHAIELIRSGRYGKLLGGTFKRVISDPLWLPDFYDPQRVGGPLIDLHVHDAHLIRMLFGMPTTVISHGRTRNGVVDYCNTLFQFEDPSLVAFATSGVINQQGREFTHGFEIHLERATLHYEFASFADKAELMPLKILTSEGEVLRPEIGGGDPTESFGDEIAEVVQCVQEDKPSAVLCGDLARDAIVLCHKQTQAVSQQQPVTV
jgi:predicted dehydrogenase